MSAFSRKGTAGPPCPKYKGVVRDKEKAIVRLTLNPQRKEDEM